MQDAPVVVNDNYAFNQDITSFVPVMSNDADVDSTILTLTGFTNPTNGVIVVNGTGFDYTPTALYTGPDSFTYRIVDDTGLVSGVATVNLNIVSTNSIPYADSVTYNFNEDTPLVATLSGSDPELSTLTYIIDFLPANGTLVASSTGGNFTYTPNADYFGSDSFSFHVFDGSYASSIETITLNVANVNDAPV